MKRSADPNPCLRLSYSTRVVMPALSCPAGSAVPARHTSAKIETAQLIDTLFSGDRASFTLVAKSRSPVKTISIFCTAATRRYSSNAGCSCVGLLMALCTGIEVLVIEARSLRNPSTFGLDRNGA